MNKLLLLWVPVLLAGVMGPVVAQDVTEQDAIDLALTVAECRDGLESRDDVTVRAYDTENAWHVWHVEFRTNEDEDMGYADVSPLNERVYYAECYFGATDEQEEAAQEPLETFIGNNAEILALLDDVADRDMYVDYDGYNDWWGVYIANDEDSLYVTVRFAERTPLSLEDPQLLKIHFAEIKSYDEWFGAASQQAVVVAFADREVGDALTSVEGWTTTSEHVGGSVWKVNFMMADTWLGSATVDIKTQAVLEISRS